MPAYDDLAPYFGDLHSHCGLSYGHGSIEDAYRNARTQLDFVSVTGHAHWPDMPFGEGHLAEVRQYHLEGFERAARHWPMFREANAANNEEGRFVSFLSFEWHSMRYGDHNVYFKDDEGEIIAAPDLESLRQRLRELRHQGVPSFLIPHHIGYRSGFRGINWSSFTDEFSPVVEIFSMHGSSEADDAPYPYLHTMGPRDSRSTMQSGLAQGNVFGIIGSTDHHSAHPGSYGHGRVGVWARELSRDALWDAITARRTYAIMGDKIDLKVLVNGQPMGSTLDRFVEVEMHGASAIDYIEILENNRTIHRWSPDEMPRPGHGEPIKVCFELGWGEVKEDTDWRVDLTLDAGHLLSVEPSFRGKDVLSPQETEPSTYAFSSWHQPDASSVSLTTKTWKNPTTVTPATQGLCLEILEGGVARLIGTINGRHIDVSLAALGHENHIEYLPGFLSPAFCFHRAIPASEYAGATSISRHIDHKNPCWYHVRVRQKNGQWAWSSPIWVGGA